MDTIPNVRVVGDHPRIRGEHRRSSCHPLVAAGSSPHTRGAPNLHEKDDDVRGIIPAYAGSTTGWAAPGISAEDHPRIRGEHRSRRTGPRLRRGSSPHTRGARRTSPTGSAPWRIIPAYAGSTVRLARMWCLAADHPRIRGEHVSSAVYGPWWRGSSPHTRGAQARPRSAIIAGGIIPAYAGSTRPVPLSAPGRPDHPRIRGEHSSIHTKGEVKSGSSPHTRGAQTLSFELAF